MTFMQWFWKYGYFIVPLIIALIWFLGSDKFHKRNAVNPEIFAQFEKIDADCSNERFNQQSQACVEILKYKAECVKISAHCDSRSHYDLLKKLDFALPPYYQ